MSKMTHIREFIRKSVIKMDARDSSNHTLRPFCAYDLTKQECFETEEPEEFESFVDKRPGSFFVFQFNGKETITSSTAKAFFSLEPMFAQMIDSIKVDFCFSLNSTQGQVLIFNMRLIEQIEAENIRSALVQVCVLRSYVVILNRDCNVEFCLTLQEKLELKATDSAEPSTAARKTSSSSSSTTFHATEAFLNESGEFHLNRASRPLLPQQTDSSLRISQILFWICSQSLTQIHWLIDCLEEESQSLASLDPTEKYKFLSTVHQFEISVNMLKYEIQEKSKFIKYCKRKIGNYEESGFLRTEHFTTVFEILHEKLNGIEKKNLEFRAEIRKIKENFSEASESTQQSQSRWLNKIMKILAIISTIYAPGNIVANLWGMNVKVPYQESESLTPFFIIVTFIVVLILLHVAYFKRLGWF